MSTTTPNPEAIAGFVVARLRELDEIIATASAERGQLRELMARAEKYVAIRRAQGVPDSPSSIGITTRRRPDATSGRLKNTDLIFEFVRAHQGLASPAIAESLIASGWSRGKNPKKLIQTQLAAMAANGRLRKDTNARYWLP